MDRSEYILNGQYSAFHFGYWMDYLMISSFAAVLLIDRGFTASEIGYVTTVAAILTILLQTALSSLADRSERITLKQLLAALILGSVAAALVMRLLPNSHAVAFVCMFTALSLTDTMQPLMTSLCLEYNAAGHRINFGVARSLGSLGYALTGLAMGRITEAFGSEIILSIFCGMYAVVLLLLLSMKRSDRPTQYAGNSPSEVEQPSGLIAFFTRYRQYDVFLLAVIMMFFMQKVVNTYMIYFVRSYGGGEAEMGTVLFVTAFAEMPAVALGVTFLKKFSPQTLLRAASIGGFVKFGAMVFIPNARWFIALMVVQFFYSGLYMVASVYFASSIVGKADAVKSQGILAVGLSGVSGIAANVVGGYMLEHISVHAVTVLGAVLSFLGVLLMFAATSKRLFRAAEK